MTRKKKCAADEPFSCGVKGRNRVRLFQHPKSKLLYLEWQDGGAKHRRSLGHSEWKIGKDDALALAAEIGRGLPTGRPLNLEELFDMYEVAHGKFVRSASNRDHTARALALFRQFFAGSLTRSVASLDSRDWNSYIQERQSGILAPQAVKKAVDETITTAATTKRKRKPKAQKLKKVRGPLGDGTVGLDLRVLRAMLNWATTVKCGEVAILSVNPLQGCKIPVEKNKLRPVASHAAFEGMRDHATSVNPAFAAFLDILESTGRRSVAVRHLRWEDYDEQERTLHWDPKWDKKRKGGAKPVRQEVIEALNALRAKLIASGQAATGYICRPARKGMEGPVCASTLRSWYLTLERLAGIQHVKGGGFHEFRRKWAVERRDYPTKDAMELGGWSDVKTFMEYQQLGLDDLRRSVDLPLIRAGG